MHPEAAHVLRRILRDIDHESLTGQGFLNVVEAALADPETALAETARCAGGAVRRLRGDRLRWQPWKSRTLAWTRGRFPST